MKKRLLPLLPALALAVSLAAPALAAPDGMAVPSTQLVDVDGTDMEFQMYALLDENGFATNYIKVRDLAYVLNGTAAQFDTDYDGDVNLYPGEPYISNGSELSSPFEGAQPYSRAASQTWIDQTGFVALDAIQLKDSSGGGYTYYQLRGLGAALGFNVYWDQSRGIACVRTDQPYTG